MKAARTTSRTGPSRTSARAGFTLIEMVAAISILVLLTTITVVSLAGAMRAQPLAQGAERTAVLIRAVRAESALTGKRFRLAFVETTAGPAGSFSPQVTWEHAPLKAPGEFLEYPGALWRIGDPAEVIVVASCRLTGPSAYRTLASEARSADDAPVCEPVTFYPDGSSDSAELVLAAVDPDYPGRATVTVDGLSGLVEHRLLSAEQAEQLREQTR